MKAYYKWRAETREYTAESAKNIFKSFLDKQAKEKERWGTDLRKAQLATKKTGKGGRNRRFQINVVPKEDVLDPAEEERQRKATEMLRLKNAGDGLMDELQIIENIIKENIGEHKLKNKKKVESENSEDDIFGF